MSEETEVSGWRKKFLANRMSFESILFEREVDTKVKKETLLVGLLGLAGIWLFHAMLLAQWVLRRGYFFSREDTESFSAVLRYVDYINANGFWALIKPELSGLDLNPPLYHLAYVPVLKFITSDLNLALVIVNSFFLLILALSVFLAVRKSRPNNAGWLGAAFALALPFVLETVRRPSPEIALMALVAAAYACYIRCEEFESNKWTAWLGVSIALGFYAHSYFWLYMLPLAPFIASGLTNPIGREDLFKTMIPGFLLNLPWYLFSGLVVLSGLVPLRGDYAGFFTALKGCAASAGLPLFTLGGLALLWMNYSVFMPYDKRKVVAALFWVPYLVITWGLCGNHPALMYSAMLFPFAVALPVMTPMKARKGVLIFVLALGAVNQSGLVPPLSIGSYSFGGLPLQPSKVYKTEEVFALIKTNSPAEGGLAGIYGADSGLNAASLRFAAVKAGCPVKFADEPVCPACASVLLAKTPAPGAAKAAASAFDEVKTQAWFGPLFEKKAELAFDDGSRLEVYTKVRGRAKVFGEGTYELKPMSLGGLKMENAALKVEGYDQLSGLYSKGEFFVPAATFFDGDIYGVDLKLTGVDLGVSGGTPVLAGVRSAQLVSGKISAYALERYLAARFPSFSDVQVSLDGGILVSATVRGHKLVASFSVSMPSPGVVELKPAMFNLGPIQVPPLFLQLFSYRLDLSDEPYGLTVSGLRLRGEMLEFY